MMITEVKEGYNHKSFRILAEKVSVSAVKGPPPLQCLCDVI